MKSKNLESTCLVNIKL